MVLALYALYCLPCIILLSVHTCFFPCLYASVAGRVLDSRKRYLGSVLWMMAFFINHLLYIIFTAEVGIFLGNAGKKESTVPVPH